MFKLDNDDILTQSEEALKAYKNGATSPFNVEDYMALAFPRLEEKANAIRLKKMQKIEPGKESIYPYYVRIPKSLDEMLEGDFEPARILEINGPIKGPYSNMWFGDTTTGIRFRWGYVNGDSRKITEDELGDNAVHGFLAGATGQGKSVTLNSIIYGCCTEYAPWELTLTLSDAKIVEFKTIAISHPLPHIDIIAATGDTDYLLSLLEKKCDEMNKRNKMFTKAGEVFKGAEVKNIKQFREVTGLTLPRNLMIFDECTAMFQNATSKQLKAIVTAIDDLGRKARSAGIHFLLASQEVSNAIPNETLANMTMRSSMGCTPAVSEKILGNDAAASNLGNKGRMIVNYNRNANNRESNIAVRVPFLSNSAVQVISDRVIDVGKAMRVQNVLRFYDEEAKLYETEYKQFLDGQKWDTSRLILGPPSFIIDGPEQFVRIPFVDGDMENICCFLNSTTSRKRAFLMLKYNMLHFPEQQHLIMSIDPFYQNECGIEELKPIKIFNEREYTQSQIISIARSSIYKRMLCVKADTYAFSDGEPAATADEIFYQHFEKGSEYDTVLNRVRMKYYIKLLETDAEIRRGFNFDNSASEAALQRRLKIATLCIKLCVEWGFTETPVVGSKIPIVWAWILGMERLIGIGRDAKSAQVESLKKLLQDGPLYGVRFIIFTTTMEDTMALYNSIKFYLLEDLQVKQQGQMKVADDWPNSTSSVLMYLFIPSGSEKTRFQKFKKLMFKGEN